MYVQYYASVLRLNNCCAVVYADGSMEESEPVTVRVRGECVSCQMQC